MPFMNTRVTSFLRRLFLAAAGGVFILIMGAFAAQNLIDWNRQRGAIERELADILGMPVMIGGDIRMSFLPESALDLGKLKIIDREHGATLTADHVSMRLKLFSLIQGQYDVTASVIEHPVLVLDDTNAPIAQNGRIEANLPVGTSRNFDDIGSARLTIVDGRVSSAKTGRELASLDADLDYSRKTSSVSGKGRINIGKRNLKLSVSLEDLRNASRHLRLLAEDETASASAVLDGALNYSDDISGLTFDGTADAIGTVALWTSDQPRSLSWHAMSKAAFKGDTFSFEQIDLILGTSHRESVFKGNGRIKLGTEFDYQARLNSDVLDIDTLIGVGNPPVILPFDAFSEIHQFFRQKSPTPSSDAFNVDVSIGRVLLGRDAMEGFSFIANGKGEAWSIESAGVSMPGGTKLDIKGTPLSTLSLANIVSGRFLLETADSARFFGWIDGEQGQAAASPPKLGSTAIRLAADAVFEPKGMWLPKLKLNYGGGEFTGNARYTFPVQLTAPQSEPDRGQIDAGLKASALDLAVFPLGSLKATPYVSPNLHLDLHIDHARYESADLEGVDVAFRRTSNRRTLEKLTVANVSGTKIEMDGFVNDAERRANLKLTAQDLSPLADTLKGLRPGPFSDVLALRSRYLSPAAIETVLVMSDEDDEPVVKFDGKGTADSTALQVHGVWQLGPTGRRNLVQLEFDADNQVQLMHQLGFSGALGTAVEPGNLTISANGNIAKGYELGIVSQAAGAKLDIAGQVTFTSASSPFDGRLKLSVPNVRRLGTIIGANPKLVSENAQAQVNGRLLASLTRLVLTDATAVFSQDGRPIATVTGETAVHLDQGPRVAGRLRADTLNARWLATIPLGVARQGPDENGGLSDTLFAAPEAPSLSGDMWIESDKLLISPELSLDDAQFVVRFKPNAIAFDRADIRFGGGRLKGDLSLVRQEGNVALASRISAVDVETARLSSLPITTRINGTIELSGDGRSPFELLKSLRGSADFELREIRMDTLDPQAVNALDRPDKVKSDDRHDLQGLASKLDDRMKPAAILAPSGRLPAKLEDGAVLFGPLNVETSAGIAKTDARLNLFDMALEASARIEAADGAHDAIVRWSGKPAALVRNVEVVPSTGSGKPLAEGSSVSGTVLNSQPN